MPDERQQRVASDPGPFPAERAFCLLCDVGAVLEEADDPAVALPRLADRVARSVADLCLIDLRSPEDGAVRVAAAHHGQALAGRAEELRRFPPDLDDPDDPVARVVRTGEPLLVPDIGAGWLQASVADPEHRKLLRALGLRSIAVAPVAARGRVLGAITLAAVGGSGPLGAETLALAEELGRRVGMALDGARLAREAREARAAESQFIAAMSHEFRTPVYVASMFAELLIMGVPDPIPASAREHAEHIRTAARHLEELVQQILTFSRLEAERERVRPERVDLAAVAREIAGMIEPLARQKGLGFGTDLPDLSVEAYTDPNKVRQILFNLLGNAVKFTDTGEVRLSLRTGPARAVVEVRDTGIGIAPEHHERIFEPFWQVERQARAGVAGAGLGLNIVRRLLHLMRGEVAVESASGGGTVFRVVLPLQHEEP